MDTAAQLIFLPLQSSPACGMSLGTFRDVFGLNLYENTLTECVSRDSKSSQTDKEVKDHKPCPWVEKGPSWWLCDWRFSEAARAGICSPKVQAEGQRDMA